MNLINKTAVGYFMQTQLSHKPKYHWRNGCHLLQAKQKGSYSLLIVPSLMYSSQMVAQ